MEAGIGRGILCGDRIPFTRVGTWGGQVGYSSVTLLTALRRGQKPRGGSEKILTVLLFCYFPKKYRLFKTL